MDSSLYGQWQLLSDNSPPADDWQKDRHPSTQQPTPAAAPAASPLAAASSLDLSEFASLADIGAPSSSPTQSFYPPFQHNGYYVSTPYPTIPYGSVAWSTSSHVPLSNYSTLNGATTGSTSSMPQPSSPQSSPPSQDQQQQHSPKPQSQPHPSQTQSQSPPQPMIIDPALTTLNGSATNMQHYPHANYAAQSSQSTQQQQTQQAQQRNPYQYATHLHHPSLSYTHASPYFQQQQQHSSPQGTLSPQALHSSSTSVMSTIMPSQFYSPLQQQQHSSAVASAALSGPSPQELKAQLQASLKPLLQASAFTGAQAVNTLVDRVLDYGSHEVDAGTRLEILTRIRDGAGNHYFRAWSENSSAIDITREWLKAAFVAKSDSQLVETIMPLLHIIDRLPMTVESLKASKLGKLVVKLVKEPPSPAIKDMASNIERRWRQIVSGADGTSKSTDNNTIEDSKTKKRKSSDSVSARSLPPAKKAATGGSSSSSSLSSSYGASGSKNVVTKKEVKPVVAALKDAKSDASFFSAPKPKNKLPSFKKAPPAPSSTQSKQEPAANVAQPSSIDPFQEALKSMAKSRRDSPAVSTPPAAATGTPPQASSSTTTMTKNGKKRKTVTWAADDQLEAIRFIEKAVYDDDPVDGTHTSHNLRDLDRGEGAALHAHVFEETVDWSEPLLVEIPIDIEVPPRGEGSAEKVAQEQREQTALGALYMSPAHIPDTPAEPSHVIPEEEVDMGAKTMTTGPEVDAIFWSNGGEPVMPASHSASVADLVGQLAVGNVDPALGGAQFNGQGLDLKSVGLDASATLSAVQALPPEQVQQLLTQLQTSTMYSQQNSGHFGAGADQQQQQTSWPTHAAEYGQGVFEDGDRSWSTSSASDSRGRGSRGGRGRGRGRGDDSGYRHIRRKPCSFFAAGRCKYGDQCDFSHDLASFS